MASPRHVFNDLPDSLKNFLSANEDFQKIAEIFFIFLKKIKNDLQHTSENPFEAARAFVILQFLKSEFGQFEKQVKAISFKEERNTLPNLFEENKVPAMPLNEGFIVEVKPKFFCSIKKMNQEPAFEWLRENGLADIIQPAVNPKTLNSALQELIGTQGVEPPENLISTYIAQVASCKKSKGAKKLFEEDNGFDAFDELMED